MTANHVGFLIMPRLVAQLSDGKPYENLQQLVAKTARYYKGLTANDRILAYGV